MPVTLFSDKLSECWNKPFVLNLGYIIKLSPSFSLPYTPLSAPIAPNVTSTTPLNPLLLVDAHIIQLADIRSKKMSTEKGKKKVYVCNGILAQ